MYLKIAENRFYMLTITTLKNLSAILQYTCQSMLYTIHKNKACQPEKGKIYFKKLNQAEKEKKKKGYRNPPFDSKSSRK